MKKIFALLTAVSLFAGILYADEGMWMLPLLKQMNAKSMAQHGCRLRPDQIYNASGISLKDAIVHFGGGCTGEVISSNGLVVTNHHCGYAAIQALSSPEHNYLENGYWAMDLSEELPAEGLKVTFLISMEDVTDRLDQSNFAESSKALVGEAEAANPHCQARVQHYYDGNVFYLIVEKVYTDVRFVGAPPASIGKFGGETDNWMWPRHTCDFSMFRIYAGADNEPASYSPDNKPYKPVTHLKLSLRGVQDGDFSMIMGYPGSTQRFQTAAQLMSMMEQREISIAARTVRQNVMWEAMMADPVVRLQYASKYARSSNGCKKWMGMREAFAKLNVIGRQEQKEAAFMEWVSSDKKRMEAYGSAIETLSESVQKTSETIKAYTLLTETLGQFELVGMVNAFSRNYNMLKGNDQISEQDRFEASLEAVAGQYKDYNEALDRKEAVALLNHYRANVTEASRIPELAAENLDVQAFVDSLYDNSSFTSEAKLRENVKSFADFQADPMCKVQIEITNALRALLMLALPVTTSSETLSARKAYTAGMLEWKKGEPSYPDANSTMRLTYGNVKSYSPKDGVRYSHYTTLRGVMEKEDPNNYEFLVPARLKEIYENGDYGRYAAKDGELHTCFITNCDITGGNSGSPVLDADGYLIGLAFDGNWESMSSDVMFEPDLQRCICVDIRYVLLMMDKFGGAGHLLKEMDIVRK